MSSSTAQGDAEQSQASNSSNNSSRQSSPVPQRVNVVRALSPNGKRYKKPVNGIQTQGFARSAQRRSSVLTLGSIERLQNFYAKRDLKLNKGGVLGFNQIVEEPDEMDQDHLPTPQAPPPSWMELDVETDLDILLERCFREIQHVLTTWSMMTGSAEDSDGSQDNGSLQTLRLLDSITQMIDAVKNYTVNRHDLSDDALSRFRRATLAFLSVVKDFEYKHRVDDEDGRSEDGYIYSNSHFNGLARERQAIIEYLRAVETYALNPPHHLGSPPTTLGPEIRALMVHTAPGTPVNEHVQAQVDSPVPSTLQQQQQPTIPNWLELRSFVDDDMGRYHAMLLDNGMADGGGDLPNPHEDEDAFLSTLADGRILCRAYNNIVKRSRRPFGFINNIHDNTERTFRAIENLRFFAGACKLRFELVFSPFDPSEVARKTDRGLAMLKNAVTTFCDRAFHELYEDMKEQSKKRQLPLRPPIESNISDYMREKLSVSADTPSP